jgi:hypothetical protein
MKVLLLKDADYQEARNLLATAHQCAATEVCLCQSFKREHGVHWHAYAYWRLRRRKYARLLQLTRCED